VKKVKNILWFCGLPFGPGPPRAGQCNGPAARSAGSQINPRAKQKPTRASQKMKLTVDLGFEGAVTDSHHPVHLFQTS
jgi:hypothetical protein